MVNILNLKKKKKYMVKNFNFNEALWKNNHPIYVQRCSFSYVSQSNKKGSNRPLSELELNYATSLAFYFRFLKNLNYILLVYFFFHFFNSKKWWIVPLLDYYWPVIQGFFILCYLLVLVRFLCFYILYWFLLFDDSLLFYLIPFYKRFLVSHIKYLIYLLGFIYFFILYYILLNDLNWSIFLERWDTSEGWWFFYDSLGNRWDRRRVWITSFYTIAFLDILVFSLAYKTCEAIIEDETDESLEGFILYYFIIWRIIYRSCFLFTLIKYLVNFIIFCLGLLLIFFLSILVLVTNILSIECMAGVIIQFLKFLYFTDSSFWSFFLDKLKYMYHLIIDYNNWATAFLSKNTLHGGPIREFEVWLFKNRKDHLSRAAYGFFNYGLKFCFFYSICYFFYIILRVFIYLFGLIYRILFFIIGLPIRFYVNYRYKDLYLKYVVMEKKLTFEEFVSLILKGNKAFKRGIEKVKKKSTLKKNKK